MEMFLKLILSACFSYRNALNNLSHWIWASLQHWSMTNLICSINHKSLGLVFFLIRIQIWHEISGLRKAFPLLFLLQMYKGMSWKRNCHCSFADEIGLCVFNKAQISDISSKAYDSLLAFLSFFCFVLFCFKTFFSFHG